MKIILDPQIFNIQQYGGISRYYTEIFSRLYNKDDLEILIPINNSNNFYFNESILNSTKQKRYLLFIKFLKIIKIYRRSRFKELKNKYLDFVLDKQEYDLFIPTYYNTYFLNHIGLKPFVLTVYDMIHELFPEYFTDDNLLVKNKLLLMEKATRIIAVSENTKKDILKIYPHIDQSKIDVVYHGCSINVKDTVNVILPKKYILFVGNREVYKNFYFLVDSISNLLKNDDDLYLICAGSSGFDSYEREFISKLGLESKILQKKFEDDELGYFYNNAKCFVFPSMYEGFGIPILESMCCGCPIVLTNYSSFPEVAGDAGIYFELNNAKDLCDKVEKLIKDESFRLEFSLKGIERAKKFKWEVAANECLNVYNKALNIKSMN